MIIKKANIIAFGGIKNKVVEFNKGINIIYGENETGKSTIQSFIKIWLYGFNNSRTKDLTVNERLRYMPLSGETIKGELWVEFNDKTYIIKRTFGKTKKEDISTVINSLTGEEVNNISVEEPGKDFLNINRSTFIKTLFIGQLGSEINKDKDEEILDKILNTVCVVDGDISVDKAFVKIDEYKKSLSNIRKNGYLDKLKDKHSLLLSERYERYSLSEKNLENEEQLLILKEKKELINSEIQNLYLYKKYLKKIKLQEEYQHIIKYLRKKEELQEKQNNISKLLASDDEDKLLSNMNLLKEDYSMYLKLLDLKEKAKIKLDNKLDELKKLEEPLKKYNYMEKLGEGISKELIRLKIEQESLKEKLDINRKIDEEITLLKNKDLLAKQSIKNAYKIADIKEEVQKELNLYEEKLKSLKFFMEKEKSSVLNKNYIKLIIVLLLGLSLFLGVKNNDITIKIALFTISLLSILLLALGDKIVTLREKSYINSLKKEIEKIELNLEKYNKIVGVLDFGQLIRSIKLYDEYLAIKENLQGIISEKYRQKEILNLRNAESKFNSNKEKINCYLEIARFDNIDDLIDDLNKFEKINKDYITLKHEVKNDEDILNDFEEQLELKKKRIFDKAIEIGLHDIDIISIGDRINELNALVNKKREINRSLLSIEETYSALIKDKDIKKIEHEVKEIINVDFSFNFNTIDEVDIEIKNNSNRLIEVEKNIKDIENQIDNLLKTKRSLTDIESEIFTIENGISEEERNLKAANLAKEVLTQAYDGLRSDFGPVLNKKVMLLFKKFTDNKYSEVLVSDKYEMKVVCNDDILSSKLLSNGANDQLYLSLRIAFIEMIFGNKDVTLYLDDAFTQYDDKRVKNILRYLALEEFNQSLIFTCQNREEAYLRENFIEHNYISL